MVFPVLVVFVMGIVTGTVVTTDNPKVEHFVAEKVLQQDDK